MIYKFGDFTVNTAKRELRRDGVVVPLEPRSYELLVFFIDHHDKAVSKEELQDGVWKTIVTDAALTRSIMKLRQSLGDGDGSMIQTVRGYGYRFTPELDTPPKAAPPPVAQPKQNNLVKGFVITIIAVAIFTAGVFYQGTDLNSSIDHKSVAVLPFNDMSEAQNQRWFADGLAEEILNSLARTPDLAVAGRTSSFSFRDSNEDIPTIADALGVAHILEGSVRREGDQIRVTAQLIRARDGMHVWSENFDHPASNLIQVQEAIAVNIAVAMKTATDPDALAALVSSGTRSVPAFEAYLRGLSGFTTMMATGDVSAYADSINHFEEAVEIDPEFALAYGEIANYWNTQLSQVAIASVRRDKSVAEIRASSEAALDNAIRYAQDPAQALHYRTIKAIAQVRLKQALQFNTEFLEARPHYRHAQAVQLNLLAQLNMFDEITKAAFEFFERDGFDSTVTGRSIHTIIYSNNEPEIRRFLDLIEGPLNRSTVAKYQAHRGLLWIGEVERARDLYNQLMASDLRGSQKAHARLRQLCAEGNVDEAQAYYETAKVEFADRRSFPWLSANTMGHSDEGLESLQQFDADENMNALAGFLLYGTFDPTPYPNLMSHLEIHGNETGEVVNTPYRCFKND